MKNDTDTGISSRLLAGAGLVLALMQPLPLLAQQDTAEFREAALQALGGSDPGGIEFDAEGWDACLGQAWLVTEGWARWELKDYHRIVDYRNGASSHTAQRRAGMDPGRIGGCGAQPDASPTPQRSFVDSTAAWPDQQLIWLTPHGFLQLLEEGPATIEAGDEGWQVSLPLERDGIDYRLIGSYNGDHELRSIRTWIDNSVFGDMEVLAEFGPYRRFGALSYPDSLTLNQGGYPVLQLDISNVQPYTEALSNDTPARGRPPGGGDSGPAYTELADGIFAFHGAYQSVAVEFDEFSVVIDGLQSDARVKEIIDQVREVIPGKPIRYVISTHSHFDHANGLRQFAAEGAMILTHQSNAEFFQQALSNPRTLRTDPTEPDVVPVQVQGVDGRYLLSDGSGQSIELYTLGASAHAADMLIAYLPSIGAIVEADILQPWINPVFGGGRHPFLVYLGEELEKIGLDYQSFVPIHTPPSPPTMDRSALEEALATP